MPKQVSCEIKCLNCEKWFQSPIQFGSVRPFDTSHMYGNLVQCRYCGQMTNCNKENMRFVERDSETGEVHYIEGEDTI